MTINLDFGELMGRALVLHAANAQKVLDELPESLIDSANKGERRRVVASFPFFRQLDKMSFDGNPEHLRGWPKIIWEHLAENGLNPQSFTRTELGKLGNNIIGNAERFYIVADWSKPGRMAESLLERTQAAEHRIATELLQNLPRLIEEATLDNREFAPVISLSGLTAPSSIFPFENKIDCLEGAPALIWESLKHCPGVFPRLLSVKTPLLHVPGLADDLNFGESGMCYWIAACWYDRQKHTGSMTRTSSSDVTNTEGPHNKTADLFQAKWFGRELQLNELRTLEEHEIGSLTAGGYFIKGHDLEKARSCLNAASMLAFEAPNVVTFFPEKSSELCLAHFWKGMFTGEKLLCLAERDYLKRAGIESFKKYGEDGFFVRFTDLDQVRRLLNAETYKYHPRSDGSCYVAVFFPSS